MQVAVEGQEDIVQHTLAWDSTIDTLLAGWCDNAKCFEWMHSEAHSKYEKRSKEFMITINCLTAIAGLSNVIAGSTTVSGFQLAWVFGGLSIFVSTLNILQDKLGYQQLSVVHSKVAARWSSIRSKIEEVVSLPYSGRRDCKTFIRYIQSDMNQATMDGNAILPKSIRKECYMRFKSVPAFDIPDICGHMEHTKVFIAPSLATGVADQDAKQPLLQNA